MLIFLTESYFFINLIYQCAEINRWLSLHQTNVLFENVSFFLKVSDEEKFLLFQYGEISGKSEMLSYFMLDARMRIHENIDPN